MTAFEANPIAFIIPAILLGAIGLISFTVLLTGWGSRCDQLRRS